MAYYQYRKTARCEYRVTDWADREWGRYATEAEAVTAVAELEAAMVAQRQQRESAVAADQAYQDATPMLTAAQLAWQEWRTWFYGAMRWAAKDTAAMQRAIDMKAEQFAGRPSFEKQEGYLADAMRENAEAAALYKRAVDLDTRIKNARRSRDTAALAEALAEALPLIDEMKPYFRDVGLPPPEPPKRSGTAPNTSIVLTAEELVFIEERFGGSKSAAIHAALDKLRQA